LIRDCARNGFEGDGACLLQRHPLPAGQILVPRRGS
jgi:hypothetical protein